MCADEMPRERLLAKGAGSLSDVELLAVTPHYNIPDDGAEHLYQSLQDAFLQFMEAFITALGEAAGDEAIAGGDKCCFTHKNPLNLLYFPRW